MSGRVSPVTENASPSGNERRVALRPAGTVVQACNELRPVTVLGDGRSGRVTVKLAGLVA